MKIYLEERRNIAYPFYLTHTYPNRPTISPFAKVQTPKKKKTKEAKKGSRKVNHQDNRKQFKMKKLEEPFSLSKAPMPTTITAATTMATLTVSSKLPRSLNTPSMPKPLGSSQMSKTWPSPMLQCHTQPLCTEIGPQRRIGMEHSRRRERINKVMIRE